MDKFSKYKGLHLDRLWNGQSPIAYFLNDQKCANLHTLQYGQISLIFGQIDMLKKCQKPIKCGTLEWSV